MQVQRLTRPPSYLVLLVGLIFCFVPLLWSGAGEIVEGADYNNPLNPGREIGQIMSGWQPDNLGEPSFRQAPRLFPYLTFWKVGESVGLSPGVIQRAWFVSLFVMCFLSAWALARALIPPERRGWTVLIAVFAYVFNPFTVSSWAVGHNVQFLAYAAAPLWLLVLYRTLQKPASMTSGIPLALVSVLFASTAQTPPMIISMIVFPSLVLLLLGVLGRTVSIRHVLPRVGAVIPWFIFVNAWWLLPFASAAADGTGYAYPGASGDLFSYTGLATPVDFSEFTRGLGFWGAYAGYNGVEYLPWAASFAQPLLIAATIWLVALAFFPLVMRRRVTIAALFAASLALVGIFVSKGINPPLAGVNRWLYLHAPGFYLLRGTYEKAGGLIFLAILIGLSLVFARTRRARIGVPLSLATLIAIGASAWPLFTGAVMPGINANGVAAVVRIPGYYNDLLKWTEEAPNVGTILSVPQGPIGYIKTTWAYAGPDPIYNFSDDPIVTGAPDARPSDGPRFAAFLTAARQFDDASFLRSLGITHVIARMDIDPFFYPGTRRPARVDASLRHNGFELAQVIGALRIYEVPGENAGPTAADEVDLRLGTDRALPYSGHLEDMDGTALVRLPQTFNKNWSLKVLPDEKGSGRVLEHLIVDNYANGWIVEGTGDIELEATYQPTIPFALGIAISAATVATGSFLLVTRRTTSSESRDQKALE